MIITFASASARKQGSIQFASGAGALPTTGTPEIPRPSIHVERSSVYVSDRIKPGEFAPGTDMELFNPLPASMRNAQAGGSSPSSASAAALPAVKSKYRHIPDYSRRFLAR